MNISILTSCTGTKKYSPDNQLGVDQFNHLHTPQFDQYEDLLDAYRLPAEDMYTGLQHKRLMQGVSHLRNTIGGENVDLNILSTGYGIVSGNQTIVPYEATFLGMSVSEILQWASHLDVPQAANRIFQKDVDVVFVLLGSTYLRALGLNENSNFSSPTVFLSSKSSQGHIKGSGKIRSIPLGRMEAKRFSTGLVALKGEIFRLIAFLISAENIKFIERLFDPEFDLLAELEVVQKNLRRNAPERRTAIPNPAVEKIIEIPDIWWDHPHKERMLYFIPDWDDQVDPDYDFINDLHSGGVGNWINQVYAHQMYDSPNYDGILISKIVADQNVRKQNRLEEMGVHRFLRVPNVFPVMGDCGAFGYIKEEIPPYITGEILEYYTRLGFNFGVSIDHLIISKELEQKESRYLLTIQNADDFLQEHRKLGLNWTPIGAVQGWDPVSYSDAAKQYVDMGYQYIALGGLVRTKTNEILRILNAVNEVVPNNINIHLFGIARLEALADFIKLGVNSVDSASYLRKAWLGSKYNYLTSNGWYSAIRIPQTSLSFRAKRIIKDGLLSKKQLEALEKSCLSELRKYAQDPKNIPHKLFNELVEFDTILSGERKDTHNNIRKTLEDRPWEKCPCDICQKWGVEVIIFRGNNRNRRRGFHNTYIYYELMEKLLAGEEVQWINKKRRTNNSSKQLPLFLKNNPL